MSKEPWRKRYIEVYNQYQDREWAAAVKDHGYNSPTWPKYKTHNGLIQFMVKFLTYAGHRATKISTTGRLVEGLQKQASGTVLTVKKWQHGSTRRGTADVSSTIRGRSCMFDAKVGSDKPSEYQLREQALEQQAGGFYFFISTPEEFLEKYDKITIK